MGFSFDLLVAHGKACPYCDTPMRVPAKKVKVRGGRSSMRTFPTRDHLIPKSRMPAQGFIIVCGGCNRDKGNRTLDEWVVRLAEQGDPRVAFVRKFMRANADRKLDMPIPTPTASREVTAP
jgi:hypothetical protein